MPVVANTSSGNSSSQDSYDYTTNYDSSEYCTATDISSDDEASYNDKEGINGFPVKTIVSRFTNLAKKFSRCGIFSYQTIIKLPL